MPVREQALPAFLLSFCSKKENAAMRLVHKYGGSSVATTEKIMAIARRAAELLGQAWG